MRCASHDGSSTKNSLQDRALQEDHHEPCGHMLKVLVWIDFVTKASWEATGRFIYPDVEKTPGCTNNEYVAQRTAHADVYR